MNDNTKRFSAATARLSVFRMMRYMTVNAFLNAWTRRHTLRRQTSHDDFRKAVDELFDRFESDGKIVFPSYNVAFIGKCDVIK